MKAPVVDIWLRLVLIRVLILVETDEEMKNRKQSAEKTPLFDLLSQTFNSANIDRPPGVDKEITQIILEEAEKDFSNRIVKKQKL